MIRVILILVLLPLSGDPKDARVHEQEMSSVKECVQAVDKFLERKPSDFNAKALVGGCRVEDLDTPAKHP